MTNKYREIKDGDWSWISKPNNGGEIGDTSDIADELNRLSERVETLEDFAKKYRAAYEPPAKHLEHRLTNEEKAALDAYRKAMGEDQ